ncbi:MAG: DNA recombination protein RmuC [Gammaproteobacteria bacterium]|nr:DNA recombination protein RmuC [Gammaproteobacteria bacterium]
MTTSNIVISLLIFAIALALGYLIATLRAQKQLRELQDKNLALQTQVDQEHRLYEQKQQALDESKKHFAETFTSLSRDALNKNNEAFLQLAQEKLKQFQVEAKGSLEMKEKAIENLVKPIKEALEKTEKQVRQIENERKEAYGALNKHLESLAETQNKLQSETRNLVAALKRPEVRGQWGEMTLKRLAELAGMVEHCDFDEQTTINTEDGRLRPDMVIRLPGGRDIVVDIKTPLDAYIAAVEADNDETRQQQLTRHARHVRDRVKELASKAYWQQFKNAPDFVVLFIPGDQFLSAALDIDRQLLEDAMKNKVILSTPTSLVALLRAIAYGWRQESLAENAEEIRALGDELYTRMATFAEHLGKLGRSLEQGVGHYNQAIGSFNTRVMPGARKFSELGVQGKKEIPDLEPVEKAARALEIETTTET